MKRVTLLGVTISLATVLVLCSSCGRDPWWTDPNATWITTYGGDHSDVGEDILLARDGGFYVVGTAGLRFGPGAQGDVYLLRADASRRVMWERTFGGEGLQFGQSMIDVSDGAVAIGGWTSSSGDDGADAYLLKVAPDGNALWSKTLKGPLDERVFAVCETEDGGYLLTGSAVDPADVVADSGMAGYLGFDGRSSIYLARTDAEGNEIWSRVHDSGANVLVAGAVRTPEDGLLVLATTTYFPDTDDDLYLLRVDPNGAEVWSRRWEDGRSFGTDLISTSDGNYLIAGAHSDGADSDRAKADFLFIKVDAAGNEIWFRSFGDPGTLDHGYVVATAADGGFVSAGNRSKDLFSRSEDLVLVKIDANGELLWERLFETATHNMFGGILAHPDGGYVVAGSTIMENDTFDVFVVKTDAEGNAEDSLD